MKGNITNNTPENNIHEDAAPNDTSLNLNLGTIEPEKLSQLAEVLKGLSETKRNIDAASQLDIEKKIIFLHKAIANLTLCYATTQDKSLGIIRDKLIKVIIDNEDIVSNENFVTNINGELTSEAATEISEINYSQIKELCKRSLLANLITGLVTEFNKPIILAYLDLLAQTPQILSTRNELFNLALSQHALGPDPDMSSVIDAITRSGIPTPSKEILNKASNNSRAVSGNNDIKIALSTFQYRHDTSLIQELLHKNCVTTSTISEQPKGTSRIDYLKDGIIERSNTPESLTLAILLLIQRNDDHFLENLIKKNRESLLNIENHNQFLVSAVANKYVKTFGILISNGVEPTKCPENEQNCIEEACKTQGSVLIYSYLNMIKSVCEEKTAEFLINHRHNTASISHSENITSVVSSDSSDTITPAFTNNLNSSTIIESLATDTIEFSTDTSNRSNYLTVNSSHSQGTLGASAFALTEPQIIQPKSALRNALEGRSYSKVVKLLLQHGAKVTDEDLELAVKNSHPSSLEVLLQARRDSKDPVSAEFLQRLLDQTKFSVVYEVILKEGEKSKYKLNTSELNFSEIESQFKWDDIYEICEKHGEKTLKHFLETMEKQHAETFRQKLSEIINSPDQQGNTPLHCAVTHNAYNSLIEILIENGAKLDTPCHDKFPLTIAIANQEPETIKLLVQKIEQEVGLSDSTNKAKILGEALAEICDPRHNNEIVLKHFVEGLSNPIQTSEEIAQQNNPIRKNLKLTTEEKSRNKHLETLFIRLNEHGITEGAQHLLNIASTELKAKMVNAVLVEAITGCNLDLLENLTNTCESIIFILRDHNLNADNFNLSSTAKHDNKEAQNSTSTSKPTSSVKVKNLTQFKTNNIHLYLDKTLEFFQSDQANSDKYARIAQILLDNGFHTSLTQEQFFDQTKDMGLTGRGYPKAAQQAEQCVIS